ncbi:hypothetical protein [Commensalibacter papalotli (ex Botero et al. 2024)]|uniref:Uncharacterized protein n=1 Tax=Commensalibacter papalotli (ex Botero et al. 2024) TaxID=2972766 RepID=A0ABM9HUL1_9PROT|nr:hypothetical protein [Commensalibacter papalotli (ex Botero et al. 2024)]CAI3957449.1 unnamed protein product [Commensalibacter papalotli (ex Botero et al. 2024)]CAI3958085.1 unnamed protein product [Commensalibacter papalotli (ex Botero et al. 2024)]
MSEYQGNYDPTEPPSYHFTGSAPSMGENDYFSFNPTPEGMRPIIDPNTRVCIGYENMESIGYDPTSGFFKISFIYDINEKEVSQYKHELTAKDVDAMSPEEAEEYHKFRRAISDEEDHGMFGGSSEEVALIVLTDGLLEALPYAMRYTRVMGKREFLKRAPEPYKRARRILKKRQTDIKNAIKEGRKQGPPTKIKISKAVLAAPITFVLRSKLKMGLSAIKLKFEETALRHMKDPQRYIPEIILEHIIRNGIRTPDSANRAFGFMYKTYVGTVFKNGKPRVVEVIVDERTWTIKHFQYVYENRLGNLSNGKGSGRIGQWINDYNKNTIFKQPHIKDIKQFKENVNSTRKVEYDSKEHKEWQWRGD